MTRIDEGVAYGTRGVALAEAWQAEGEHVHGALEEVSRRELTELLAEQRGQLVLDRGQRRRMKRLLQKTRSRIEALRARVLLLLHEGHEPSTAATIAGCARATVYRTIHRFEDLCRAPQLMLPSQACIRSFGTSSKVTRFFCRLNWSLI